MDRFMFLCVLVMLWVGTYSDDSSTCSSASGVNTCKGMKDAGKLAPVLRNAVSETQLQQIEALVSHVETSGRSGLSNQAREFGEPQLYTAGHRVTYLHEHAPEDIFLLLRNSVKLVGDSIKAWGVADAGNLSLRCMEAISYRVEGNDMPQNDTKLNELTWHHDGSSWITVSIPLTSSGVDYTGGQFEIRHKGKTQIVKNLRRGDLLAWRGWHEHRVQPVISGRRSGLVAEFWTGQQCTTKIERADDTKQTLLQAIELDSSSPILHSMLAARYQYDDNNSTAARQSFHAAIRADPKHYRAYYALAKIAVESNDDSTAEKYFKKSLELNPGHINAHTQLALLNKRQGNVAAAESNYLSVLDSQEHTKETFVKFGDLLSDQGDDAAALRSYLLAVHNDPKSAEKHAKLGKFFQNKNGLEDARKSYETALSLDSTHVQALIGIAEVGNPNEAKKMLQRAVKLRPAELPILANLANTYLNLGEHKKAATSFKKAIALAPKSVELHGRQAKAYFRMDDLEAARQSLYNAMRAEPRSGKVLSDLGFVEMKLGNWNEAEKHWVTSIELNPRDPRAHIQLGSALGYKGDFAGATAAFNTALRMSPRDDYAKGGMMAVERQMVGSTGIWDKLWKGATI